MEGGVAAAQARQRRMRRAAKAKELTERVRTSRPQTFYLPDLVA